MHDQALFEQMEEGRAPPCKAMQSRLKTLTCTIGVPSLRDLQQSRMAWTEGCLSMRNAVAHHTAGLCSVLWQLKGHLDMALCSQVVHLIWPGQPAVQQILCFRIRQSIAVAVQAPHTHLTELSNSISGHGHTQGIHMQGRVIRSRVQRQERTLGRRRVSQSQ